MHRDDRIRSAESDADRDLAAGNRPAPSSPSVPSSPSWSTAPAGRAPGGSVTTSGAGESDEPTDDPTPVAVPADELVEIAVRVLGAAGTPEPTARAVATSLVESDLVGHDSHGVRRLVPYVDAVRAPPIAAPRGSSVAVGIAGAGYGRVHRLTSRRANRSVTPDPSAGQGFDRLARDRRDEVEVLVGGEDGQPGLFGGRRDQ
ncbi:Ldh family oxidoreductase [Plantactinospora sp. WMMB334]|uniref:Ldh family oxidoreductase n=1 Tax=Plantactinospora sp. WMMB334 TaxID=3404119 RepID=UPI003B94E896